MLTAVRMFVSLSPTIKCFHEWNAKQITSNLISTVCRNKLLSKESYRNLMPIGKDFQGLLNLLNLTLDIKAHNLTYFYYDRVSRFF